MTRLRFSQKTQKKKKKKKRDYNGSNSQYKTCSYISDYRLL